MTAAVRAGSHRLHCRPGVRGVPQADAIRAWAKDQGISVSARGRIPANIVERYEAATKER